MDVIKRVWYGFLNYVARHSPAYKEIETEKDSLKQTSSDRIERLQKSVWCLRKRGKDKDKRLVKARESTRRRIERLEYQNSMQISEVKREFLEISSQYEATSSENEELRFRVTNLRSAKNLLERKLSELEEDREESVPYTSIRQIARSLQALKIPAVFLNHALRPIHANRFAGGLLKKRDPESPLFSEEETMYFLETASKTSQPFLYQYEGSMFNNWAAAPVIDKKGRFYGCFLTNQATAIAYFRYLFSRGEEEFDNPLSDVKEEEFIAAPRKGLILPEGAG